MALDRQWFSPLHATSHRTLQALSLPTSARIAGSHAGRVGEPEDIAEMCLFLADNQRAKFITGQHFIVDGGVTAKLVYPE